MRHAALVALALLACKGEGPPNVETDCDDGVDNDDDGLLDCDDLEDCGDSVLCLPDTETDCEDGVDDDGDGLTDCEDDDCTCVETACDDGEDDDGDGQIDCDDSDCDEELPCLGLEAWGYRGSATYAEDDTDGDGTADSWSYDGVTEVFDEVVQNGLGRYEVGDSLCVLTFPVQAATEPQPAVPCEGCEFAVLVEHSDGEMDGPECSQWYDSSDLAASTVQEWYPGIGYHASYGGGGPSSMYYYVDPDTSDGDATGWYPEYWDNTVSFDEGSGSFTWSATSPDTYQYY